eukprot:350742-Chlamydomonas_euryale.AAC.17
MGRENGRCMDGRMERVCVSGFAPHLAVLVTACGFACPASRQQHSIDAGEHRCTRAGLLFPAANTRVCGPCPGALSLDFWLEGPEPAAPRACPAAVQVEVTTCPTAARPLGEVADGGMCCSGGAFVMRACVGRVPEDCARVVVRDLTYDEVWGMDRDWPPP